jgi:hypothetical protein
VKELNNKQYIDVIDDKSFKPVSLIETGKVSRKFSTSLSLQQIPVDFPQAVYIPGTVERTFQEVEDTLTTVAEKEGFAVSKKGASSKDNINKLNQRMYYELAASSGFDTLALNSGSPEKVGQISQRTTDLVLQTSWFDKAGQLKLLSDPTSEEILQPESRDEGVALKRSRPLPENILSSDFGSKFAELRIIISGMLFHDHELFCKEDYLVGQLRSIYYEYAALVRSDTLKHHLQILDKLQENHVEDFGNMEEYLITLSLVMSEYNKMKRLEKNIYEKWKEIKEERKSVSCVNSRLKVVMKEVEPIDYEKIAGATRHALKLLDTIPTNKLKGPQLDKQRLILDRFLNSHSSSSKYALRVTEDNICNDDNTVQAQERTRRSNVRLTSVFMKLFVNNQYISTSQSAFLTWPTYSAEMNHEFVLDVFRMPSSVHLEVWEKKGWSTKFVGKVHVALPGQSTNMIPIHSVAPKVSTHSFASDTPIDRWSFTKPPVVSDNRPVSSWGGDRYVNGALTTVISWGGKGENAQSSIDVPVLPPKAKDDIASATTHLIGNTQKLEKSTFAEESDFVTIAAHLSECIDLNDPRNIQLKQTQREKTLHKARGSRFSVDKTDPSCLFTTGDENIYQESRRHTLLHIRRENPKLYYQYASDPLPLTEKEIMNDLNLNLLLAEYKYVDDNDGAEDEDRMKVKRQKEHQERINNFLKRAREAQQKIMGKRKNKSLKSIVKERTLPLPRSFDFSMIGGAFEPVRKLRPKVQQPRAGGREVDVCTLHIQIVRGKNIPMRRNRKVVMEAAEEGERRFNKSRSPQRRQPVARTELSKYSGDIYTSDGNERVMSFIEIHFQEQKIVRTQTVEGPSPAWNENLALNFTPPRNDFTPEALGEVRDNVVFSLFDEISTISKLDDRASDTFVTVKENRYLGSFSIPFQTIYINQKVEGFFEVQTPPFNLAYEKEFTSKGAPNEKRSSLISDGAGTYINVMATLDPVLVTPDQDEMPMRGEPPKYMKAAAKFEKAALENYDRKVSIMVPNASGEARLVTRYIWPQIPPKNSYDKTMTSIDEVVRFVSLIPFLNDWSVNPGSLDLWYTTQDFLDILAGDWEEHCTLLCNFFMYIDRGNKTFESYIVTGEAIPEGESMYVLRYNSVEKTGVLWNAATGVGYSIADPNCPMRAVHSVANNENVWVNIQSDIEPFKMTWEIPFNTRNWLPFFTEKFKNPNEPTVQIEELVYHPIDFDFIDDLENSIREEIKREFRMWRMQRSHTHW